MRVIEAPHNNDDLGNFHEDERVMGWKYEASDKQGTKFEISAVYNKDFPPSAEIAITKEGGKIEPIILPKSKALGTDLDTIKSSLSEVAQKCASLIESGVDLEKITDWLNTLEDEQ
jgi:hypothetical protein